MRLGAGGDDVAQERFRAFDIDGEIIVDEKDGDLAALASRPSLQEQQLIHNALICAKTNGVAKKAGYRAELASVGAPAPRFDGDNAKRAPAFADALQRTRRPFCNQIKLREVNFVPRNRRILPEAGFSLLA